MLWGPGRPLAEPFPFRAVGPVCPVYPGGEIKDGTYSHPPAQPTIILSSMSNPAVKSIQNIQGKRRVFFYTDTTKSLRSNALNVCSFRRPTDGAACTWQDIFCYRKKQEEVVCPVLINALADQIGSRLWPLGGGELSEKRRVFLTLE